MIIAQINILPQEEIDRRRNRSKPFLDCPLCEHSLEFTHTKDQLSEVPLVTEFPSCPNCAVVLPDLIHTLH